MIDAVVNFFLAFPQLGYLTVFISAFSESVAFLGIFVPGTVIVVIAGFFAEQWAGSFNIWFLWVIAVLGAFLGSVATYLFGRYYGPPLFSENNFYLKRRYLEHAQSYFEEHGGKSIFTGQFLGPLRSLVPLVAGMAEMKLWSFLSWSFVSSVAWSGAYLAVGYFFGASWEAIQLWGTRFTFFVVVFILFLFVNWLIGRFLVQHERQVRAVIISIGVSVARGFLQNEYVAKLLGRFPRFFDFWSKRFSTKHVFGLPFTVATVASFIVLFYLLTLINAVVREGPLQIIDARILGAVLFVRDPLVHPLMLFITNLAGPAVVGIVITVVFFFWAQGQTLRAVALGFGTLIVGLLNIATKYIFARPRPDAFLALASESTASFPSGHAVMAVVVYGFITFGLLGYVQRWRSKIVISLFSSSLIGLIGFSRIYLGVHWPSDVLGGYLFGAWWLILLLLITYLGEHSFARPVPPRAPTRIVVIGTLVVLLGALAALVSYGQSHPLRTVQRGTIIVFPDVVAEHFSIDLLNAIPKKTETLAGRSQAPINLVFVGSRGALLRAFDRAGWSVADSISIHSVGRTVKASLENESYPNAPISPTFYDGRVQDIGQQQETSSRTVRERHHVRLWLAPIALRDGETVWVGSASFDKSVAYSPVLKFPTHIIDPDIDKERDYIRDALVETGLVEKQTTVPLTERILGRTAAGSPFFTDGLAHVLWLETAEP